MAMVLTENIVQQVAESLWLVDLFHLQATDTLTRAVCSRDILWSMLVSRELSGLELSPALLKQTGRRGTIRLLRELRRSQVSMSGGACAGLTQAKELQKLTRLLSSVDRSAQVTLAHGGCPKIVFVSRMRFSSNTLAESLPSRQQVQDMRNWSQVVYPSCIGDSLPLQHMTAPLGDLVPEPPGATFSRWTDGLMLHLALQGRNLLLQVRNDGMPPSDVMLSEPGAVHNSALAGSERLEIVSLDIKASSSSFMMDFRDIELTVNQPWKNCGGTGLLAMLSGRAETVDALSKSIPLVVCIRRGKSNFQLSPGLAGSLNVDSIRQ